MRSDLVTVVTVGIIAALADPLATQLTSDSIATPVGTSFIECQYSTAARSGNWCKQWWS